MGVVEDERSAFAAGPIDERTHHENIFVSLLAVQIFFILILFSVRGRRRVLLFLLNNSAAGLLTARPPTDV